MSKHLSVPGGRTLVLVALLALAVFTLSACGGGNQAQQQDGAQQDQSATGDSGSGDSASSDSGSSDSGSGDSASSGSGSGDSGSGDSGSSSSGSSSSGNEVYEVGNAGEVEFRFADGRLELIEVRPNEGWNYEIDEDGPEEIDVDFRRGNEEWEFEAEVEDGQLQIEIDRDIED